MISCIVLLAFVRLTASIAGAHSALEALCSSQRIELTGRSQFLDLADQLARMEQNNFERDEHIAECLRRVRPAIADLALIVRDPNNEACTMKMAQRMKQYYHSYLDTSSDSGLQRGAGTGTTKPPPPPVTKLPKSFKQFALAYFLRSSNLCHWNTFDILIKTDTDNRLLRDEDLKLLGRISRDDGIVSQLVDELNGPGDIVLPSDLAALKSRTSVNELPSASNKIYIQSEFSKIIKRIQTVCEKRFQPVYEQLIMPQTVLASVGINYVDRKLRAEFKNDTQRQKITLWARTVFICETMRVVEPVDLLVVGSGEGEDPDQVWLGDGGGVALRVLTKEEADEIASKQQARPSEIETEPPSANTLAAEKLERIDYVMPKLTAKLDDLILDRADSSLLRAIKRVKTNKTHLERIKARMLRRSLTNLKSQALQGHLKMVLTTPVKAFWRRLTSTKSQVNSQLNSELLNYVERIIKTDLYGSPKMGPLAVTELVIDVVLILACLALVGWFIFKVVILIATGIAVG
jgi:predicted double-glycine peptidase